MTGDIPRWHRHPQTVTHPSTDLAELNSQLVDHKSDALTTTLPSYPIPLNQTAMDRKRTRTRTGHTAVTIIKLSG